MADKPLKELWNRQTLHAWHFKQSWKKKNIQKHPKETRSNLNNLICGKVSISINLYFTNFLQGWYFFATWTFLWKLWRHSHYKSCPEGKKWQLVNLLKSANNSSNLSCSDLTCFQMELNWFLLCRTSQGF